MSTDGRSLTNQTVVQIREIFEPLIAKKAWGASIGIGSFLTIDFGEPIAVNTHGAKPKGEWHLWIQYCFWRLEKDGFVMVASEDGRTLLKEEVAKLNHNNLTSIAVNERTFETSFEFSNGFTIRTAPASYWQDYEHWILYEPGGYVTVAGPGFNLARSVE